MGPSLLHNLVHNQIIVTKLTNQIGHLVPDMIDETGFNVDELWDADTSEYQWYLCLRYAADGYCSYNK